MFAPWYTPRPADHLVARLLTERTDDGVRACIITGAPGVGKTSFARALAEGMGGRLIEYYAHHWSNDEDLFVAVDPARVAAIAGGHDMPLAKTYRRGALLRATLLSRRMPVVLLLDEWDKAPEYCDALLLEFLQSGTVHGRHGERWRANTRQLAVVITSNGLRELIEPLQRRCFRYEMPYLSPEIESDVLRKTTGAPVGAIRLVVKTMNLIRANGRSSPSLQEGMMLLRGMALANGVDEVRLLVRGYLVKDSQDEGALKSLGDVAVSLWGEWKRGNGKEAH